MFRDLCKTPPFAQIALKLHFVPASGSNFKPQNTQCIPAFKIFALTRGIHAPRPSGNLAVVQFCYPAELPLNLNKIERFAKVSFLPVR